MLLDTLEMVFKFRKESKINIGSQELPTKLISDIFEADKETIVKLFIVGFVYATIITGILYYLIKFIILKVRVLIQMRYI